jgi:hypothetical protein
MAGLIAGCLFATLFAAVGVVLILNRELRLWVIERTTVRSAKQLRGSYLKHLDFAIAVDHWLLPAMAFIVAAICLVSGIRAVK